MLILQVECRRTSLLEYFGEHFSSSECLQTCDNCKSQALGFQVEEIDVTEDCRVLLNMGKDRLNVL
jgi:bloom syndrome protein